MRALRILLVSNNEVTGAEACKVLSPTGVALFEVAEELAEVSTIVVAVAVVGRIEAVLVGLIEVGEAVLDTTGLDAVVLAVVEVKASVAVDARDAGSADPVITWIDVEV